MPRARFFKYSVLLITLSVFGASCQAVPSTESNSVAKQVSYEDLDSPTRFDSEIDRLTAADNSEAFAPGAVLFVGSSSIRMWHSRIAEDLYPIRCIARGFGGSNFADLLHFSERIVFPYDPSAIVLYEGDNDLSEGIDPEQILEKFIVFETMVRNRLQGTEIYFIAIKPSIDRIALLDKVSRTNRLIDAHCQDSELLHFIDIATPILKADGTPNAELFIEDMLHLNDKGYDLWSSIIRPYLLANL